MLCTEVFRTFLHDYGEQINLFMFTVRMAGRIDDNAIVAAKALLLTAANDEQRQELNKTIESKGRTVKALSKFSKANGRNLLLNSVDSFLWYFSAIVQSAMKKKPELLKSAETIRVDDVLGFKRHAEIVSYLIDKKTNELSYGGLREMEKYVKDRLGVDAFEEPEKRALLGVIIELRNIYVHNRGIVNRLFLSRVPKNKLFNFKEGERYHFSLEEYFVFTEAIIKSAMTLDDKVASKFKLRRKKLTTWNAL